MTPFQKIFCGFCAITLLGVPGAIPAQPGGAAGQTDAVLIQDCGCSITPPRGYRVTARNERLVVAQSIRLIEGRRIPVTLRFLCAPNVRRTSMISEIRSEAREKNMNVRRFETFQLTEGVDAAVFLKSRIFQGRVIQNAEAYFASRANEYFLYIIPETGGGTPPAGLETQILGEARDALKSLRFFASIEPTITEANYRARYYGLLGVGAAGLALLALLLARSYFVAARKRRRAQQDANRKAKEADNADESDPNDASDAAS